MSFAFEDVRLINPENYESLRRSFGEGRAEFDGIFELTITSKR